MRHAALTVLFTGIAMSAVVACSGLALNAQREDRSVFSRDMLVTREELFGSRLENDFRLSPNGSFVSFQRQTETGIGVFVRAIRSGETTLVDDNALGQTVYQGWTDGSELFVIGRAPRDQQGPGRAYLFTPTTRARRDLKFSEGLELAYTVITKLHRHYPVRLFTEPAIGGPTRKVVLMDFHGGQLVNTQLMRGAYPITSPLGRLGLATAPQEDGGALWYRWGPEAWLPLMATTSLDSRQGTGILDFQPQSGRVVFADAHDSDTLGLTEIDLNSGATKRVTSETSDVTDALILNGRVQAYMTEFASPTWHILDPSVAGDLEWLRGRFGAEVRVQDRSADDSKWLIEAITDTAPMRAFIFDRKLMRLVPISHNHLPWLRWLKPRPMQTFTFNGAHGRQGVAYLTQPERNQEAIKKTPLVVLIHGGPRMRDHFGFNFLHQWLASRGYAVLSLNFAGSRGYGKSFERQAPDLWGEGTITEIFLAISKAQMFDHVDTTKVGLMGFSFGGYTAVNAASIRPQSVACAVALSAPLDLPSFLEAVGGEQSEIGKDLIDQFGLDKRIEPMHELARLSPTSRVRYIRAPILVVSGDDDIVAPKRSAEAFIAALQSAGNSSFTFLRLSGFGHDYSGVSARFALGVVENFLANCLGGVAQPLTRAEASVTHLVTGKSLTSFGSHGTQEEDQR